MLFSTALLVSLSGCSQGPKVKPRIGAVLRSFEDEESSSLRKSMETAALDKAEPSILDGQDQAAAQELQLKTLFADHKLAALAFEAVEPSVLPSVIDQAKQHQIPLVLFGDLPSDDTMRSWDKLFFVGTKEEDIGQAQGELLAAVLKTSTKVGKSKALRIALLGGDKSPTARSEAIIKALAGAGYSASDAGSFEDLASLAKNPEKIDAAICLDSDFTTEAIRAQAAPATKAVPVIGLVSSPPTPEVEEALRSGSLAGVAVCDQAAIGKAIFDLSNALALEQNPAKAGLKISDAKFIWVPCQKLSKANLPKTAAKH